MILEIIILPLNYTYPLDRIELSLKGYESFMRPLHYRGINYGLYLQNYRATLLLLGAKPSRGLDGHIHFVLRLVSEEVLNF